MLFFAFCLLTTLLSSLSNIPNIPKKKAGLQPASAPDIYLIIFTISRGATDKLKMDSMGNDHQLPSSADLFFSSDHHQHSMDADQAQPQEMDGAGSSDSLNINSPFLNGPAGSNMGMTGVMAALQSLGNNNRVPSLSDDDQTAAEDPATAQGQGQLREQTMLEQLKLAQLKQLQELQQQIFQQQVCLLQPFSSTANFCSDGTHHQWICYSREPAASGSVSAYISRPANSRFIH